MRRTLHLALLALWIPLAGCPLPQPLPDYTTGTITPPRILVDEIARATLDPSGALTSGAPDAGNPGNGNPIIFVPSNCTTTAPVYDLWARVVDTNNTESIQARWFVNYDPLSSSNQMWLHQDTIPANADTNDLVREIPPPVGAVRQFFEFRPYDFGPAPGAPAVTPVPSPSGPNWWPQAGILRVVELVVSNGFDASIVTTKTPLPNRGPKPGFETQVYRWVFLTVPESSQAPCPQ